MSAAISLANSTLTLPGASSQFGQRLRERLVGVRGVGDKRLEQRDGCRLARP
jgi:hypothetical protein